MTGQSTIAPSVAQRAAAGAGWIIAWRVATRNIGLLSTLILVRLLRPEDFGLVALATGFISSVDALSAFGVQDALVRAPALNRDLYDTGFGLNILRGVITALIIAAIAWPVANFFSDPRLAAVMLALSGATLISAFENIGIVDFRREIAFRKEFDMQLWSRVVGVVITITIAFIWRSYWALIGGILAYRLVRLVQSYRMSSYRPRLTIRAWRQIFGFSFWTWAQTMLLQARERLDSIVIGRVLGTPQVGVFAVGLELGSLPTTELVEPLCRALFSGFASLHNASIGLGNILLKAIGLGLLLILPAGFGISMVADPMVRLCLGEHWLSAVPVMQILAIGGTTAIFTQCCANLLNAVGQPRVTFLVGLVSALIKLLALVLLIPGFGLSGAAIAFLVSGITDLVLLLWAALPLAAVSLLQVATCAVRPVVATAVMVLVLWLFGLAWSPSLGHDVFEYGQDAVTRSALGAACYGIALLGIWCLAGRPDGPERFMLVTTANLWRQVNQASYFHRNTKSI